MDENADVTDTAGMACHELLLRLAGRLPDTTLWRYRDWLSLGAFEVLAKTLPKSLLRHGIDLNQDDHALLVRALIPYGADSDQVSSALGVADDTGSRYTFTETAERPNAVDAVIAVVDAALRGRPDVGEVRESWRHDEIDRARPAKRVLLVVAIAGWARLTGELQRVLRVLGDELPSVEVLPPRFELGGYHLAALENARTVSVGAEDVRSRLPASWMEAS